MLQSGCCGKAMWANTQSGHERHPAHHPRGGVDTDVSVPLTTEPTWGSSRMPRAGERGGKGTEPELNTRPDERRHAPERVIPLRKKRALLAIPAR